MQNKKGEEKSQTSKEIDVTLRFKVHIFSRE